MDVYGNAECNENLKTTLLSMSQQPSLEQQLENFWIVEQCENKDRLLTEDQKTCEEIFRTTTVRDESGRYVVDLPFKSNYTNLGYNLNNAINRFRGLENRFKRDDLYYREYKKFINEYEELGHMTELKNLTSPFESCY